MKVGYLSDRGKKRELDEDSIIIVRNNAVYGSDKDQAVLLVVADGMGGHNAGEVASRLATAKVAEEMVRVMIERDQRDSFDEKGENPLINAVKRANSYIFNEVKKNPQYKGMGTTVTAAVVLGHTVYIGHVGDSRAYIINEKEIRQITTDHSLVQEMVDRGEIKREEAKEHPRKNIITRAVGIYEDIDVDIFKEYIYGEDYLLICCDGLTDMVLDEDICKMVRRYGDPQKICCELVRKANKNGGLDNISVIVAQFDELPGIKLIESHKTQIIDRDETRILEEDG
jgi:protein phosphatase